MAKILNPNSLVRSSTLANLGVDGNIWIDTATLTVSMNTHGLLTTEGASIQAVYSYLKEQWKIDPSLIKFPFPMIAITPEQFEFVDGWRPADAATSNLFRDGGYAIKNADGTSAEEYAGIITLGSIGASDQVYYQQVLDGTSTNVVLTGAVNQCVKVYGDGGSHGIDNASALDYRSYFKIFVREYQKLYAQSQLSDIGVSSFTYQAYRFPLANSADLKITHDDATVSSALPYTDMNITYLNGIGFTTFADATAYVADSVVQDSTGRWFITAAGGTSSTAGALDVASDTGITDWVSYVGERQVGTTWYPFSIVVNADVANNGGLPTAEQIYEFVQYSLRQNVDIDASTGSVIGKTADRLLKFVGDTLVTSTGVFIDNFSNTDINRIEFVDVSGTKRTFPFVAAGTINFNSNLVNDSGAVYKMFFTDIAGKAFGTVSAIIVQDKNGVDIAGAVTGPQASFTFDYDGNVQGGRVAGTDAQVTVCAIGTNLAQYVKTTSVIGRSNSNVVSLVSSLERNYI